MQQMLAPKEIAEATVGVGKYKTSKKNSIVFVSAMLAGLFIGLGYTGYLIVSGIMADAAVGKVVGALLFPVGLLLVLIAGADLFTGNTLVTMAWYKKEIKLGDVAKNLSIVWLGNLVGALFLVVLVYYSNTFTGSIAEGVMHLAEKKVHLNMVELLTRSTLCNILVAITVYMSYAAKDVTGKVIISYIRFGYSLLQDLNTAWQTCSFYQWDIYLEQILRLDKLWLILFQLQSEIL